MSDIDAVVIFFGVDGDDDTDDADGKRYKEPSDMTLEGKNDRFSPIGAFCSNYFNASYDGGGYVIDGLRMNRPTEFYAALFANIGHDSSACIINHGLAHLDIDASIYRGYCCSML